MSDNEMQKTSSKPVRSDIEGINNIFEWENFYLAGMPTKEALRELAKKGVTKVFNLRGDGEADFTQLESELKELGVDYYHHPIMESGKLSSKACLELNKKVSEQDKILIHCGSANRVAGWFITYLVLEKNYALEEALDYAQCAGLANPDFIGQAQNIITQNS